MSIWDIVPDATHYRSLTHPEESPEEYLDRLNCLRTGRPVGGLWGPLKVELLGIEGEAKKPIGDFFSLAGGIPLVLAERALRVLMPLIGSDVEVLTIASNFGQLHALNVLSAQCLDQTKSSFKQFSDGRVMRVLRYAFDPDCLRGSSIFRIPGEIMSRTFANDAFRQQVEENNLRGLIFHRVPE